MEPSTTHPQASWHPNPKGTGRVETASDGRLLLLEEAESRFEYSYDAVARLARNRRGLPGDEPPITST